jgi:NADH-quinone oxidoreductase subunit F
MGTPRSAGSVVCTVVGDVEAPGVGEVELGTPLAEVIEKVGGGLGAGRHPKAVFPGVALPVITPEHLDTPLSYEDMAAAGSGLGAAGLIVYDDTTCMVEVARVLSRFLYVESCGQCPPCKLGSGEITEHLDRLDWGEGGDGDVELIGGRLHTVTDGNRCYLAVEEQQVVSSILRRFPEEFAEHIETGRCPRPRGLVVPKVVELGGGRAVYDERQSLKEPDWTYRAGEDAST